MYQPISEKSVGKGVNYDIHSFTDIKRFLFGQSETYFCKRCKTLHIISTIEGLKHSLIKNIYGVFRQNPFDFELDYTQSRQLWMV